jgi:hypothetical protein
MIGMQLGIDVHTLCMRLYASRETVARPSDGHALIILGLFTSIVALGAPASVSLERTIQPNLTAPWLAAKLSILSIRRHPQTIYYVGDRGCTTQGHA